MDPAAAPVYRRPVPIPGRAGAEQKEFVLDSEQRVGEAAVGAEQYEKQKLRKSFRRFDIFFFLICALVGVDTIGSAAKNGAQGFTWLIFLAAVFFVPYGLIAAELGSAFAGEGGCYLWTRYAFGDLMASITAFFYWISVPIWVGGALFISALAASDAFFTPLQGSGRYLFGLAFIWLSIGCAIASVRHGKWIPTIGAWARFIVLTFFTFSVGVYAWKNGIHGFRPHDFLPTYSLFITVVPVLVFNYSGFELPSSAGAEMTDPQKDVPFAVALSAVGAILLYGLPILAILLVLPQDNVTGLNGFIDAIKAVFTVYGGHAGKEGVTLTGWGQALGGASAILFIMSVFSSSTSWLMGSDRVMAVAGYSGTAPRALGHISSRFGTPIVVNLLSGVVATLVMVLAFQFAGTNNKKYFDVVLGLAISTTTISYLAVFPSAIRLRYSHDDVKRPYRIPGGKAGIWLAGGLATFWTTLATVGLLWPGIGVGWFHSGGDPDSALPSHFTRWEYEVTQIAPLIPLILAALAFYYIARAESRKRRGTESA